MAALVEQGFEGNPVDLAFCVGDLSYATGYLGKWETFMNAVGPVSSRVHGARFSTEIYTRGCHWFPRLFA
jgi:hypothetical protein